MEYEPARASSDPDEPQPTEPAEVEVTNETSRTSFSSEEAQSLGRLALIEPVERIIDAGAGKKPEPLALQGVIAELRRQAANRRRLSRVETA